MQYDVLLIGDYWFDLIFTDLPGLPELGKEIFARSFDNVPGGSFINAVALQRMGLRVGWAADFGDDHFSRFILEAARRERLDDSLFQYHARPYRRVTASASFPHDRAFLSYTDPAPAVGAALKALVQHTARAVMFPGLYFGPLFEVGQLALRARETKIVMDCQSNDCTLGQSEVRHAIQHVDVFLPNSAEARQLTGTRTTLEAVRALGEACPLVVVKDGPDGAHAIRGTETFYAPAIPVQVIDTTGAGDAFNAGFMKAWLDDKSIDECLRWGNICGGLSTTARGGATAVPTLEQVQAWLNKDEGGRMKDEN
jgi:hypothetical protein